MVALTVSAFDTLEYANELKAADVPDKQAEAQAKALRSVLEAVLPVLPMLIAKEGLRQASGYAQEGA